MFAYIMCADGSYKSLKAAERTLYDSTCAYGAFFGRKSKRRKRKKSANRNSRANKSRVIDPRAWKEKWSFRKNVIFILSVHKISKKLAVIEPLFLIKKKMPVLRY